MDDKWRHTHKKETKLFRFFSPINYEIKEWQFNKNWNNLHTKTRSDRHTRTHARPYLQLDCGQKYTQHFMRMRNKTFLINSTKFVITCVTLPADTYAMMYICAFCTSNFTGNKHGLVGWLFVCLVQFDLYISCVYCCTVWHGNVCNTIFASAIDMEITDKIAQTATVNQSVNGTDKCMEYRKFVHKSSHSFAKLMAHLISYLKTCIKYVCVCLFLTHSPNLSVRVSASRCLYTYFQCKELLFLIYFNAMNVFAKKKEFKLTENKINSKGDGGKNVHTHSKNS